MTIALWLLLKVSIFIYNNIINCINLGAGPTFVSAHASISFQLEDGINLTISVSVLYSHDYSIISNVIISRCHLNYYGKSVSHFSLLQSLD